MHVAFDAVMLSLLLFPDAKPPKPVKDVAKRIRLLIDQLEEAGAKIIIPTPVLSEFLVHTGPIDGPVYLSDLTTSDVFDIQPFDLRAAAEASELHRKAKAAGDKRAGSPHPWQVVKVDRQFVAIAKVNGVTCIYSDDEGVQKMAASAGIACKGVEDLPLPEADQQDLFSNPTVASTVPEQPSGQDAIPEALKALLTSEELAVLNMPATDASPSSGSAPPSGQSAAVEPAKATQPAPGLPAAPPIAPAPQQPGSSGPGVPPVQSKK